MNAQKIWPGSDYAMGYQRKGGPLPLNARRVKVRQIIKKPRDRWAKRDSTFVEVMIVNDETGMPDNFDKLDIREVSGREILEFWDEYIETVEDEREEYLQREREAEERRKQAAIKRQEENAVYYIGQFLRESWRRELRIRAEREKQEKEAIRKARETRLVNVMIGRGFRRSEFVPQYGLDGERMAITFDELERWFGFDS